MAVTVEAAFNELLNRLRASRAEAAIAASHRESIRLKLERSFGMTQFFRSGSFGNGTNLSGISDVDYFAVIPPENLNADSSATLAAIAASLRERFPFTVGIRVNSPAVQVPFGLDGAEMTEIVPVLSTGTTVLGFRQFEMPDCNGGWMFSAPESHNAYVQKIDTRLNGRVKPLIRFLKAWKAYRNVDIRSFYLEMRAAAYADNEQTIVYDIDLKRLFDTMLNDGLADFPDPRFPNDGFMISACTTPFQRVGALTALQRAKDWSDEAFSFRIAGQHERAFGRWDLIFNWNFPVFTG
ncbi:nucleotidyltransferase domain-containing protein [Lacisediminimonas profundi]|uniref:nucleotidyltransferase domain-containing protein n=1 Tax=Lacisediminimonas profundi TaxID=2603856 RepID=UPI00124B0762|nr:nucleotidyltransferase [Lacisediminimonas profundi]